MALYHLILCIFRYHLTLAANLTISGMIYERSVDTYAPCKNFKKNGCYQCDNKLCADLTKAIKLSPLHLLKTGRCMHRGREHNVYTPIQFEIYTNDFRCV